jgi:hypothetical protein
VFFVPRHESASPAPEQSIAMGSLLRTSVPANAFGLYGTGLTPIHVHNLATISEIEALPDLRLLLLLGFASVL